MFRGYRAGVSLLRGAYTLVGGEMNEKKKIESAEALNRILLEENKNLREEVATLSKIKEVQDESLKVADEIIKDLKSMVEG